MPHDDNIIGETIIQPSTLENIDTAMHSYIDNELNLFSSTNKGWKKVPVLWMAAERSFQVKDRKELRDSNGVLILPLITVERTSISKDPAKKGMFYGPIDANSDYRGGSIMIKKRINQDKTANFANADALRSRNLLDGGSRHHRRGQINFPRPNKKVVYQQMSIPMPVYVDINYTVTLRTEYQQQMNEVLAPFITRTGAINSFLLERNDHQYEAFIQQEFAQENNVASLDDAERTYQTKVTINVLGYLIGDDKNEERPRVVIRENAVQVRIQRERVIMGDEVVHTDKSGFYRE